MHLCDAKRWRWLLMWLALTSLGGCFRAFEPETLSDDIVVPDLDAGEAVSDLDTGFVLPDLGPVGDLGFDCTCSKADINQDGVVDSYDFSIFSSCYSKPPQGQCSAADLDGNGVVGMSDFGCLKQMFGQVC